MTPIIRAIRKEDIQSLKEVLDSIELFPSQILEDLTSDFFTNPATTDIWFAATEQEVPISIGYCAPEKLTEGTFNLYAIGVKQDIQGKGIGTAMMQYLEEHLTQKGHRILIVETSGTDDFELTRTFYENLGYHKEAVIRDFWSEGDDKVIYWKKLK